MANLLLCIYRNSKAFILFLLIFLSPLNLNAEWSFPFNSAPQPKPVPAVSAGGAVVVKPDKIEPVISAKSPVLALPAKVQPQSAPLVPLPEALPEKTGSTKVAPPTRGLAPFAPSLKSGSRTITEDSVWNGAVQIEGMVTVAAQATLTLLPGTVVRFGPDSGILVLGRIVAKGSPETPITFASQYSEPYPADWYGVVLTDTSKKNVFEQVVIMGAESAIHARFSTFAVKNIRVESSVTAIRMMDSIGSLKNVTISGCSTGISAQKSEIELETVAIEKGKTGLTVSSSAVSAEKLKISAFTQAALVAEKSRFLIAKSLFSASLTGARISACEGTIINSRFTANIETGVAVSGSILKFNANLVTGSKVGLQLEDNLTAAWGNSIYGNSNYNLLYLGDEPVYVGGNWLGTANAEAINKRIFSKRPDAVQLLPVLTLEPLFVSEPVF